MIGQIPRREFLFTMAAAGAALLPQRPATEDIRFGYAAITWGGNDLQAIDDVAAVGYPGIQLRSNVLEKFGAAPGELRDLLAKRKLTMVALSSGGVQIDPAVEADEIAKHTKHAKFVKDVGGLYLQVTDSKPSGRTVVDADYVRLGTLMTEIGRRTADIGIPLVYHNHMNAIGERPHEVQSILNAADPKYVKLLLDIAHYQQGGGNPVEAIRTYADRISFLHIKDLEAPVPGASGDLSRSYRFVELGRGKVDVKAVLGALRDVRFKGWAVVELDRVPDDARTPKESAVIAKTYLEQLGYPVGAR